MLFSVDDIDVISTQMPLFMEALSENSNKMCFSLHLANMVAMQGHKDELKLNFILMKSNIFLSQIICLYLFSKFRL